MKIRLATACLLLATLLIAGPAEARNGGGPSGARDGGPFAEVLTGLREINERLDGIDSRLLALEEANAPCTPAAIAEGRCTREDLSTLTAQVCTTLETKAALNAGYGIDGNTEVELGLGWEEAVDADVHWNLGVPFLLPVTPPVGPIPPLLAPLPDVGLTGEAGGGVALEVCFQAVEIPGGDVESLGERLAVAAQNAAPQIRQATRSVAEEHGLLQPERVVAVAEGLRRVGAPDVGTGNDGLVFFDRRAEMGRLAAALPIGSGVRQLLDDPRGRFPDREQLGQACEVAAATPALAPMAADACGVLDTLPRLDQVTQAFELVPDIRERLFRIEDRVDRIQQAVESATPDPPPPPGGGFDPCSIPVVGRFCR